MVPKPNKIDRLLEGLSIALTGEEAAELRVAIVALVKLEQRIAWNDGAETIDREWWESEYSGNNGGCYWGYVESLKNPHRRVEDEAADGSV